jgi:hypothetical protein
MPGLPPPGSPGKFKIGLLKGCATAPRRHQTNNRRPSLIPEDPPVPKMTGSLAFGILKTLQRFLSFPVNFN